MDISSNLMKKLSDNFLDAEINPVKVPTGKLNIVNGTEEDLFGPQPKSPFNPKTIIKKEKGMELSKVWEDGLGHTQLFDIFLCDCIWYANKCLLSVGIFR